MSQSQTVYNRLFLLLPQARTIRPTPKNRDEQLMNGVERKLGFSQFRLFFIAGFLLLPLAASPQEKALEPAMKEDLAPSEFQAQREAEELAPEPVITDSDREHWAYLPLERPLVPEGKNPWVRNPIDRFMLARFAAMSLQPMPEADRVTLIRRVTYDLTGLPPTPEDVERFLKDQSPDAYERLVDRLLASPEYGIRWAQHWLDLARFAETDGFEYDSVRPEAWRYRDWVVDALNADMPYDRFAALQIAGDVLDPENPDSIVATGFLLCGPDMPDINLQEERRHVVLNEMTSTVGAVFLGMQVGCAQCHDHKFDPISQRDFYRLRAFFENLDLFKDHPLPKTESAPRQKAWEAKRTKRLAELETQLSKLEQAALAKATKAGDAELASDFEALLQKHLTEKDQKQHKTLSAEWDKLRQQSSPPPDMGRVAKERDKTSPAYLWIRGDFRRQGPELEAGFLRVANLQELSPAAKESQRVELARWLTRPDHPLFGRVMVNRLWQHHFGKGLSASPSNFGVMGFEPTDPKLLDWLAAEFATDWSVKRMHRLMVTSATYRMASRPFSPRWSDAENKLARERWQDAAVIDPENEHLTRMRRRRLEGEAIRDALLAVSGQLSQNREGEGVRPPLPEELVATLIKDKNQWAVTKDENDHTRRSLYLFVRRNLRFPIFEVFDQPDTNSSCDARPRSTIAPQALTMMNSELTFTAAQTLASLVLADANRTEAERVRSVFLKTFSREPTTKETEAALAFLKSQTELLANEHPERKAHADAWRDFCLAMLNTNEFLYVD